VEACQWLSFDSHSLSQLGTSPYLQHQMHMSSGRAGYTLGGDEMNQDQDREGLPSDRHGVEKTINDAAEQ
jgi:hypothetical protein